MWETDADAVREYHYYNQEGVFIGKSEGTSPQKDLFDQAHYVFDDQSDIVKNLDLLAIAKRKLANLRKELIGVPLKDITRIIELNQEIEELEGCIESLAKSLNQDSA
ncbi:MAG: hypothetical protein CMK89_15525 [Pseudomonadales bacterium]|nr:hypothetical protein [Pseudomonadales bacterium]